MTRDETLLRITTSASTDEPVYLYDPDLYLQQRNRRRKSSAVSAEPAYQLQDFSAVFQPRSASCPAPISSRNSSRRRSDACPQDVPETEDNEEGVDTDMNAQVSSNYLFFSRDGKNGGSARTRWMPRKRVTSAVSHLMGWLLPA